MTLSWTNAAIRDLQKLPKEIAGRITKKMEWYASQNSPLTFAKHLTNSLYGDYRFRVGNYRVICDTHNDAVHILFVLSVKHRKEAYRDL